MRLSLGESAVDDKISTLDLIVVRMCKFVTYLIKPIFEECEPPISLSSIR